MESADQIIKHLEIESGGMFDAANVKYILRTQVKTADYTVTEADSGTYFTTYGDGGAIVYTLPSNPKIGLYYYFFQSVDQDMTIDSDTGEMITFNDTAADGIAATDDNYQTGALIFVFADGRRWNAAVLSNGTTYTVS